MAEQYDVLILGSGQAGNPLSSDFVKAGKRVALIERAEVAGTCINYGCTPTKTMVASAQRAWQARHAAELGIEVGSVRVNMEQIRARCFPGSVIGAEAAAVARYDMRTVHAAAFGGSGGYVLDRCSVLQAIDRFVESERRR